MIRKPSTGRQIDVQAIDNFKKLANRNATRDIRDAECVLSWPMCREEGIFRGVLYLWRWNTERQRSSFVTREVCVNGVLAFGHCSKRIYNCIDKWEVDSLLIVVL